MRNTHNYHKINTKACGYHLNIVLHVQIIDHIRPPQLCILNRLLQRKTLRMERNEAIAQRPTLHRIFEYNVLGEHNHPNVLELLQTRQNLLHRFRLGFLGHGANADQHLFAGVGRHAAIGVDAIAGLTAQINVALPEEMEQITRTLAIIYSLLAIRWCDLFNFTFMQSSQKHRSSSSSSSSS